MAIYANTNGFLANPIDEDGCEIGYDEWLTELYTNDSLSEEAMLNEMYEAYEHGEPEERHLIAYEMLLQRNEL